MDDDFEHLVLGCGFAGPDFKLAGSLLDEHFDAGDDGDALGAGELEEGGVDGVVDEVEDELGFELGGVDEGLRGDARHADGGGVDDDVEGGFGEGFALDDLGSGLAGEFGGGLRGAVEDGDVCALVAEGEDGGAGGSAGSEDEDACSL